MSLFASFWFGPLLILIIACDFNYWKWIQTPLKLPNPSLQIRQSPSHNPPKLLLHLWVSSSTNQLSQSFILYMLISQLIISLQAHQPGTLLHQIRLILWYRSCQGLLVEARILQVPRVSSILLILINKMMLQLKLQMLKLQAQLLLKMNIQMHILKV